MTDTLIDRLTSGEPEIRQAALQECIASPERIGEACLPILEQRLFSLEVATKEREAAATALACCPAARAGDFLLGVLEGNDPQVRQLAAIGLGFRTEERSVQALIRRLEDPVNTVRNVAERSLIQQMALVRKCGLPALIELLEHPVALTRSPAARLLGLSEDPQVFPHLAELLRTETEWLGRIWVTRALGNLGDPRAFPLLAERLQHDDKNRVRAAAAESLGQMRNPDAKPLLEAALQDDDPGVQKAAEEALKMLGMSGVVEEADPFAED